jgi:hypothetical protein
MSGIKMKGFEDLKRNVEQFSKIVQDEAIKAAEDAAAQVVKIFSISTSFIESSRDSLFSMVSLLKPHKGQILDCISEKRVVHFWQIILLNLLIAIGRSNIGSISAFTFL